MNTLTQNARTCPACHQASLVEATREKHFSPLGETITVALRVSRCPACGAELINAEQRRENLQRLRERKAAYGHLLLGEEIVALRKKYGLTQQAAAKIFGKGKIAFSRYENETSYPDQSTTKLLKRAIAQPQVLKALADEEGVEIPLWQARCEDERRAKLAVIKEVQASDESRAVWQRLRNETGRHVPIGWLSGSKRPSLLAQQVRIEGVVANDDDAAEAKAL